MEDGHAGHSDTRPPIHDLGNPGESLASKFICDAATLLVAEVSIDELRH